MDTVTKNRVAKRAKPTEIISHWPKLIEGLCYSPQEFYAKVEKALTNRQVPELRGWRVDWKEGGPLSARREYLRLQRERLVFDICGAPFGTGFFVSIWFGEKPLRLGLLSWLLIGLALYALLDLFVRMPVSIFRTAWLEWHLGPVQSLLVVIAVFLGSLIVAAIAAGPALDDLLIRTPIVGYFYERYFRRITYYRVDQTCMYQQAVHAAVMQVIDDISQAKGIRPLSELDRRPVFQELFRREARTNGRH